jgi:hypothetical protein
MMERVGDRLEKMEGYCSTGQSPQRDVVPVEGEEGEEEEEVHLVGFTIRKFVTMHGHMNVKKRMPVT